MDSVCGGSGLSTAAGADGRRGRPPLTGYVYDRRAAEIRGEQLGVQRGRHQDQPQVGPLRQQVTQDHQQKVAEGRGHGSEIIAVHGGSTGDRGTNERLLHINHKLTYRLVTVQTDM